MTTKEEVGKFMQEYFDEEKAIAEMLKEGLLFANSRQYWCEWEKKLQSETLVLFLNCNDVFAWALADAESVKLNEVEELYTMWKADKKYGDMKWVCKKRNLRPQRAWVERLKKEGAWDAFFESLPDNKC